MKRTRIQRAAALAFASLSVALATSCATAPEAPVPFGADQMAALTGMARDPRTLWLTVYAGNPDPVYGNANRLHAGQIALLGFRAEGDRPVVELHPGFVDGADALIDTSSPESWLDAALWSAFRPVPLGPNPTPRLPTHVRDDIPGVLCAVPKLMFSRLHMENALLYVRAATGPMWPLSRSREGRRVRAVIGANLLRSFSFVTFAFAERRVLLAATRAYAPDREALVAEVPVRWERDLPTVRGTLNGQPRTFRIDTAGDFSLFVPGEPAATWRHVSIGTLVFRDVPSAADDEERPLAGSEARIGRGLLREFVVTLDNRRRVLVFERLAGGGE
jgi:hypothetical protein